MIFNYYYYKYLVFINIKKHSHALLCNFSWINSKSHNKLTIILEAIRNFFKLWGNYNCLVI